MSRSMGLFLCAALGLGSAHAAVVSIIVDSTSGAHNVPDACVLRDAISFANTGVSIGGCVAQGTTSAPTTAPNSYTIVLPQAATITLTEVDDATTNAGLPPITAVLSIFGNGSVIQRNPELGCNQNGATDAGEFRLLYSTGILTLNDLTLRGGCADSASYLLAYGGALDSFGVLTLNRVVLSDNYASNRGGGLYAVTYGSQDTINDSTFRDNKAPSGAGLFLEGAASNLRVERSLFLRNSSVYGSGASIAENATAVFVNSTFANNSADSAASAIAADGLVTLVSSTLAENEGNAFQISTPGGAGQKATIKNSLFSANTGWNGNCFFGPNANVTLAGVNLSSDTNCTGFALTGTDAKLTPLADNGGPTLTYALQADSPAIDAVLDCTDADATALDKDQRWHQRPQNLSNMAQARCDIGAYERDDAIFGDGFDPIVQ